MYVYVYKNYSHRIYKLNINIPYLNIIIAYIIS